MIFQVLFIRRDRFIFYPFSLPVIDLFCLIALANTSSTMSNCSGDCGHPSLVADLRGDVCSVSPLNKELDLGLIHI